MAAVPPTPKLDSGTDPMEVSIKEDQKSAQQIAAADQSVSPKALDLVWMRVRDLQSRCVIAERVMKKDDVFLPKDTGLVLALGRANQIEIWLAGNPPGLASASVPPRHNVSLDPSHLKQSG